MTRKYKPGSMVRLKRGGIPMLVTMYIDQARQDYSGMLRVTWATLDGKTKTANYHEDQLIAFTKKEWNGKAV